MFFCCSEQECSRPFSSLFESLRNCSVISKQSFDTRQENQCFQHFLFFWGVIFVIRRKIACCAVTFCAVTKRSNCPKKSNQKCCCKNRAGKKLQFYVSSLLSFKFKRSFLLPLQLMMGVAFKAKVGVVWNALNLNTSTTVAAS